MLSPRVTATNLAVHAHTQCDLYLHQSYHGVNTSLVPDEAPTRGAGHRETPAAISLANFASGNDWESTLFTHLDQYGLLLTNEGPPLSGADIASVIELEERPHFFAAGIEFWPPRQRLLEEYAKRGVAVEEVPHFGLAKPDLVEIWRQGNGTHIWRIIDAKASKEVKTSHLVQTYFYHLCLSLMLPSSFIPAPTVAIWLPSGHSSQSNPSVASPSLTSLHPTPIAPLVAPLSNLLFSRLPIILSSAPSDVSWHFNPLCRSCPFSRTCHARAEKEGALGKAGEVSLREATEVRVFVQLSKRMRQAVPFPKRQGEDIEDLVPNLSSLTIRTEGLDQDSELGQLAALFDDEASMKAMEKKWPASSKRVQRNLGIQPRDESRSKMRSGVQAGNGLISPMVEAALTNTPQFTNRRIYTLPSSEDIAIYISLIIDPSRPASVSYISEYCITTQIAPHFEVIALKSNFEQPRHAHGSVGALIPALSKCIRNVLDLHAQILSRTHPRDLEIEDYEVRRRVPEDLPRTQFYVWSTAERDAIQKHLINAALGSHVAQNPSTEASGTWDPDDIRLCIGALCEGASLLATAFQPHVLEGALLGFLGKKGKSKEDMKAVMHRLGIKFQGDETAEAMRQRIVAEIEHLGTHGMQHREGERRTVGLLPRIVVLKKELRRLVALPVPGWWDVREAAFSLGVVGNATRCPDESELFRRYWHGESAPLREGIQGRNEACSALVGELRRRVLCLRDAKELLVNRARVLRAEWVDVCRVEGLRKLFYMQQFEVLLKLQELWDARIEGCPDAPLLVYRSMATSTPGGRKHGKNGDESKAAVYLHTFYLVAGNLEVAPERDRDRAFFDFLLVEEAHKNDRSEDTGRGSSQLPLEALFDDLCVSGLVFPLNRYTRGKWDDGQACEVRDGKLWMADVRDVKIEGGRTEVVLRVWSSSGARKALLPGRTYRLSPRLVDFNTTKVLSTLVELDLQVDTTGSSIGPSTLPPFAQLVSSPKSFGGHTASPDSRADLRKKVVLDAEAALHRLYTELRDLGNENAGALVLKASQRRATRRILGERLTVIWGPPGSGKSYTIALSLLRMLEVQSRTRTLAPGQRQIIFLTAMTHAAIQACLSKLRKLIDRYRTVPDLSLEWLDELSVEHVLTGNTHPKPPPSTAVRGKTRSSEDTKFKTWIYAGTVYQLYNFGKRFNHSVDCIVIDEAGQLGLGAASLVLRALSGSESTWGGKVVVAGDREQLAPIFSGHYPELESNQRLLFGSVLDCLMGRDEWDGEDAEGTGMTTPEDKSVGTVVQLLENFRLNPDLGNFVQTIYKRAFKPQKVQAKRVAMQLSRLEGESSRDVVSEKARELLLALAGAMLGKQQALFEPPQKQDIVKRVAGEVTPNDHGLYSDPTLTPRPISLALLQLCVQGDSRGEMAYESHVRAEAKVAAALVRLLGSACRAEAGERGDDIFVACPHRVQRAAVKAAVSRWDENGNARGNDDEDEELERLIKEMTIRGEEEEGPASPKVKGVNISSRSSIPVVIDTIERLQGSEASFVICLFSHTHRGSLSTALPFLLARRRLNVAISRAKTLCIVIASEGVLNPGVSVFADRESARGYAFLRAFQERAWNAEIEVGLEG